MDGEDRRARHSPEPWTQVGQYIRDARGQIVVRGRSAEDARRIAAAINATREIPTEALERWFAEDVSDAATRPDLELEIEPPPRSPLQVLPPESVAVPFDEPSAVQAFEPSPQTASEEHGLLFDRRVFERRIAVRRAGPDRRKTERRRTIRRT